MIKRKDFITLYRQHRSSILRLVYAYLLFSLIGSAVNISAKKRLLSLFKLNKEVVKKEEKENLDIDNTDKNKAENSIKSLKQFLWNIGDVKMANILGMQILILIAKIYISLNIIKIDSKLVSSLVSQKYKRFARLILIWLLIGIPQSYLSSLSNYFTNTLSKILSANISDYLMKDYLKTIDKTKSAQDNLNAFYKINHLSNEITDPHQRLAVDIFEFSKNLSSIPTLVFNPFLNLTVYSAKLVNYKDGSMTELVLLFGMLINISTIFIKLASPRFSRISNTYSQMESKFRQVHSNIIQHFEQIAFLRGWNRELYDADKTYFIMERFLRTTYRKLAFYNFIKTFIMKYTWGALGLSLCAFPIFNNSDSDAKDEITQDFISNRSLLMNASNAMGDLLSSKKNIDQIVGTSKRIIEMKNVLVKLSNENISSKYDSEVVHDNNLIKFENVPLYTPANKLLCRPLNFSISQGDNLLIIGPNGSGKSSLFRLLSGLWPVVSGRLTIPEYNSIFYLPQRPYLLKGKTSLIEQIVYPRSIEDFDNEYYNDSIESRKVYKKIIHIMRILQLENLLKENSDPDDDMLTFGKNENKMFNYETSSSEEESDEEDENLPSFHLLVNVLYLKKNWAENLSIGSQQKLAMARLYFHCPKFAVLDECTSQVTPEMEEKMYTYATEDLGITVLSVAHRKPIWKFHKFLLQFDGDSGYLFKKFDYKKRLALIEEKQEIERTLNGIPTLQTRLKELYLVKENQTTLITVE